uniref:Transthyretin-like family protein n=1 Tax=Setaria digitata TaxID=48799 RepID=A0A915PZK2_9BILA
MLLCTILLSAMLYILTGSETMQTIAVQGQVKCAQKNVVNTVVVLGIDIRFVDEQILAITKTNITGWFELKATIMSADTIRPFFHVYIGQFSGIKCHQRYKQSIPKEFITKNGQPERWYRAGVIDLQDICVQLPSETSCLIENLHSSK